MKLFAALGAWWRERATDKVPMHQRRFVAGEPTPCTCACHRNPGMMHAAPCCAPCSHCGTLFAGGILVHERGCTSRPEV